MSPCRKLHGVRALLLLALVACGSTASTEPVSAPSEAPKGGNTAAERFFPLEEGKIYSYGMREGEDSGMSVAKVHRTDATHGELRFSNATKRYAVLPDGITYAGGAYILKAPLEKGTSWPGEHGGTMTISAVDAAVTVPAGSYAGCLVTTEEGSQTRPGVKYETTYCPGVGIVLNVVTAPVGSARVELRSYGSPVKIEGTGLTISH